MSFKFEGLLFSEKIVNADLQVYPISRSSCKRIPILDYSVRLLLFEKIVNANL